MAWILKAHIFKTRLLDLPKSRPTASLIAVSFSFTIFLIDSNCPSLHSYDNVFLDLNAACSPEAASAHLSSDVSAMAMLEEFTE